MSTICFSKLQMPDHEFQLKTQTRLSTLIIKCNVENSYSQSACVIDLIKFEISTMHLVLYI